ncbi:MAG TPA: DUF433 domain-containing protein [Longimicrobium sp.]|jgi:uncharacterized protein (DUF433 family)|nr:DUF433 domain-containing protein [Longimicrobium sp.]
MRRNVIYGGADPRELPGYTIADASRYIHVPKATLRSWFLGRTYPRRGGVAEFVRLLTPAGAAAPQLSFLNLVEAHVLRALRTEHDVSLAGIRAALETAEKRLGVERVLLSDQLLTSAGELFLEHYGELISLSRSGQFAMKKMLQAYLRRVVWDDKHIPIRLFPFLRDTENAGPSPIVIDPRKSFGRPTIVGSGVMTHVLTDRIDAGETVEELARDYDISPAHIESAILFEKAA